MSRWIKPVSLRGSKVILEPLGMQHAAGLIDAASDGKLWELWYTKIPAPADMDTYVAKALSMREADGAIPFVVIEAATGDVVGCTRIFAVDVENQRAEIGYTWYAKRVQRSTVNTESKLLLLQHAFESLGAIAIEFRTHWHNHASRRAIARLGAKQDGVLRHHQKSPDGVFRDTVVFSIIAAEWPTVRQALTFKLTNRDD